MTDRAPLQAQLARLGPDRRRQVLTLAAGLVLVGALVPVLNAPEKGVALLAVALCGLFLVTQPHWGILVIFVLVTLRLSPRIGPLSGSELLGAALLLPLGLEVLRDRKIWALQVPHIRLLLGVGGVLLVATGWSLMMHPAPPAWAVDARWSEQISFFRFLVLLILFVYFIKTPRQLGHAVAVVLLMILLLAADGAGVFEGGWDSDRAQAATFGGFAGNQNRLGFLCVWGIALFWALRFRAPAGWWRRITLVPLLALPIVTLMTGSRSGLLQLMLLAGLILLEQRQWSPAQRTRAFALVAVVALVVVLAAPSAMVQRATTLDMGGFTTIHRLHTYEAGIMMVLENPLFGVGPGNFDWRNHVTTGRALSAHNSYLWALTSGGPLLLILYLAVFHRIYRTLRTVERHGTGPFVWLATALRLNLITLLLFSFFGTIWQAEPFWLLVGLTIVVARVSRVPLQAAPPTAAPVLVAAR